MQRCFLVARFLPSPFYEGTHYTTPCSKVSSSSHRPFQPLPGQLAGDAWQGEQLSNLYLSLGAGLYCLQKCTPTRLPNRCSNTQPDYKDCFPLLCIVARPRSMIANHKPATTGGMSSDSNLKKYIRTFLSLFGPFPLAIEKLLGQLKTDALKKILISSSVENWNSIKWMWFSLQVKRKIRTSIGKNFNSECHSLKY